MPKVGDMLVFLESGQRSDLRFAAGQKITVTAVSGDDDPHVQIDIDPFMWWKVSRFAPVTARQTGDVLFSASETIATSETGGSKGVKPLRYDLIPVEALAEVAYMYGVGSVKYGDRNFEKGYPYSSSIAALQRHLEKFKSGVDFDDDSPQDMPEPHHLAAVVFHALALMQFQAKGVGTDDRPSQ